MSLRMPAAERREQLLAVALDVFAGEGYHQTSMNQIAEAAGITKPVLYQHFASKRELYLALIEEAGGRLLHIITAPSITETSGRRRVELGFLAYFQWVYDDHDSFNCSLVVDRDEMPNSAKPQASFNRSWQTPLSH